MSTITIDSVSRWYGNVVAVNGISMTVGPGVTGLLGPNGAGKTTLIALMAGFLAPSAGSVTLDGTAIWRHTDAYRTIGLVPEREVSFGYLTGRQFVLANAELHGLADPGAAASARSRSSRWSSRPSAGSAPTPRACASGSSSPPRSSTTRPSCCSTSRSTASTRASACT